MLAGREGFEPSCASFGGSPDPRARPTFGAIGGIRTRTAALVARRSSARRPIASAAPERFERSSSRLTSARIAAIMLQGITGGGAGSRTLISCLQDSHPTVERNPRVPELGRASGIEPEPARSHRVVQRHYTMPATSSSIVVVVVFGAATSTCTRLSALRVRRVALYALATDLPEEGFEPPRRCV